MVSIQRIRASGVTLSNQLQMMTARTRWIDTARPNQITPPGEWSTWMVMAGRGFGKTRTGAEDLGWYGWKNPRSFLAVVAPTADDLRDTCFEGESGLLNIIPPECVKAYNRSLLEMVLQNGTIIRSYSSETPERLRGPQFHRAWCDELAAWKAVNMKMTWDMLTFGMRLGERPQRVVTTTPKPYPLLFQLVNDPKTVLTTGSTYENLGNLAPTFRDEVLKYEGTGLGRQEINAELISPEEMGIFKRNWFRLYPLGLRLPKFQLIVKSYDTAFTEKTMDKKSKEPDPTVCTTWGIFNVKDALPPEWVDKYQIKFPCGIILLDAWEEWLGFDDLMARALKDAKTKYGVPARVADLTIIENEGSGQSLRQVLERRGLSVRKFNPGNSSKTTRAHIVSHIAANRMIFIPESSIKGRKGHFVKWSEGFLEQVCQYAGEGTTLHDDYLDSFTQVLRYCDLEGYLPRKDDKKDKAKEEDERKAVGGNPYDTGAGVQDNAYVM